MTKKEHCKKCGLGCTEKSINYIEILPKLSKKKRELQLELGLYCDEAIGLL